jgi:hypothetical protein
VELRDSRRSVVVHPLQEWRAMRAGTLLSSLLLLAGGCVIVLDTTEPPEPGGGGPPPPPPTESQARQAFDRDVYPILVAECGSCHSASPQPTSGWVFLAPGDLDKSYELVKSMVFVSEPDASRLLTKGTHAGPPLKPGEANAIRNWLDLEAAGL